MKQLNKMIIILQACDTDEKGYLTEEDLNLALDRIMDQQHDKTEIKKIFGVLNSSSAKVNLRTFKQKVFDYAQRKVELDKENDNNLEYDNEVESINDNKNIQNRSFIISRT